jgi:hypothetical protein
MQVLNSSWQLVGVATPVTLVAQNVGTCRIAFVFATVAPGAGAITLDSDGHFILEPGSAPMTVTDLSVSALSMYARALGPISGKLAVHYT